MGDIRAINAQFVDAYQLKTVDTIQESDLSKFGGFVRSDEGKIRMESSLADEDLFREDADGPLPDADGSRPFDWWDVVIRCTGWEFDSSIFDTTTQPAMVAGPASHKYPQLTDDFSTSVADMYVTGTLAHGLDWRKSSGGFIHGFRYNVRALARTLEMDNHGVLWPHEVVPIPSGAASAEAAYRNLSISVLKRCSDTSALYQMFKRLFDLYVFTEDGQVLRFEELNPGQIEPVLERASADPDIGEVAHYFTVCFQYGTGFSGPGVDTLSAARVVRPHATESEYGPGHLMNFIHPVVRQNCYDEATCAAADSLLFHVSEDVHTNFLRPRFDVAPLAAHLMREGVLRFAPAVSELDGAAPEAPDAKDRRATTAKQNRQLQSGQPEPALASGPGPELQMVQNVPLFTDSAIGSEDDQGLLPWLAEYIMSREQEWRALPLGAEESDESLLGSRREHFNVLNSGRTKKEKRRLRALRGVIRDAWLRFIAAWQSQVARRAQADGADGDPWIPYVRSIDWAKVPGVYIECWAEVFRGPTTAAPPTDMPLMLPFHGWLTLGQHAGNVTVRSPFTDRGFDVRGAPNQLALLPGGLQISSSMLSAGSAPQHPVVALRFNIDVRHRIECRIPLVMSWCVRQSKSHWASLMGKDDLADAFGDGRTLGMVDVLAEQLLGTGGAPGSGEQ